MNSEQHAQLNWFKSSYSSGEGGACVEVATAVPQQPTQPEWFKSTHSGDEGGECVEVATATAAVHVRDSKERGGPQLIFTPNAWSGFVAEVGLSRSH
ncbi:DUF397 domain-containing protein [Streptomyces sp. NPDC055078]